MNELSPLNITTPIVTEKNGELYCNSRDVAALFGKRHVDLMRSIKLLILEDEEWGVRSFTHTHENSTQNGMIYFSYDMTKDAFTELVMGFNGAVARQFTRAYIQRFNEMEATLKQQVTVSTQLLSNPQALLDALTGASQKVIALEEQASTLGVMVNSQARTIHEQRKDVALAQTFKADDDTMSNTDINTFTFGSAPLRVVTINDEPWFVMKDIMGPVGLNGHASQHMYRLEGSNKQTISRKTVGFSDALFDSLRDKGANALILISESGLYKIVHGQTNHKHLSSRTG